MFAMYRLPVLFHLLLLVYPGSIVYAQESQPTENPSQLAIHSLISGQALQGNVSITGNSAVEGFRSARLDFSYADNPTGTWFVIQLSDEPVANGTLAQWNTTTITDGTYTLRLTVTLEDGSQTSVSIYGLRVRNYTPIETPTPTPITPTATLVPGGFPIPAVTLTPSATLIPPTSTPLPPNPDQLSTRDIAISMGKATLAVIGLFGLAGLYQVIRSTKQ